ISCGLDTERFCPAQTSTRGAHGVTRPTTTPLILCVARHVKVKNLGLLLDACAELRKRGVQFQCAMIGDGPCRAELDEARARLGLAEIVEMPGAAEQGEVLNWWRRAAVGVLSSENEGMPVSLME